jgi:hypothetical protein
MLKSEELRHETDVTFPPVSAAHVLVAEREVVA